jgi:hypothetical protein
MADRSNSMEAHSPRRPDPDPTVLTTASLLREIRNLHDLFETRITGIEKLMAVFHEHMPMESDRQVQCLKEVVAQRFMTCDEKFERINTQILERDTRMEQTARDSKVAIDAALTAQEKAVGKQTETFQLSIDKSEKATTKAIDALQELLGTRTNAIDSILNDLKTRFAATEGRGTGHGETWGYVLGAVGLLATVMSIAWYIGHMTPHG